jgi:dipeptidyl aminopeptidase/acylaminoacyl peptidase
MNYFFLFFILISLSASALAQKPALDTNAIRKWPSVANPAITNDGNYALYTINNHPFESRTLVIQSTNSTWKKEFEGVSQECFTNDSKTLIFRKGDTLNFLHLGTDKWSYVVNVNSYKQPIHGKREWLAYQLKNASRELVLRNLITGQEHHYIDVTDWSFDDSGRSVLLKTEHLMDNILTYRLQWLNLSDANMLLIWHSLDLSLVTRYSFDAIGKQLTFIVQKKVGNSIQNTLWYYHIGMDKAVMHVDDYTPGIDSRLSINNDIPKFSKNGQWIYFSLKQTEISKPKTNAVKIDVWSYQDKELQSVQLKNPKSRTFQAVVSIKNNKVIRLEHENEKSTLTELDNIIIINDNEFGDPSNVEPWWNKSFPKSYYLLSLNDGSKKFLTKVENPEFAFSPKGRYIVYYDRRQNNYFSYDVVKGKTNNISRDIPTLLTYEKSDKFDNNDYSTVGIAGWFAEDSALLVYDNYDIWQVNSAGDKSAINVTNNYGTKHRIKLRLVLKSEHNTSRKIIDPNEPLLITAFSTINKNNGFFKKSINKRGDPELLTMGPYNLFRLQSQQSSINTTLTQYYPLIVKAKESDIWIVRRMSTNEAPNFFITNDFKHYTPLSNIQPQKKFTWLTAELIKWKQLDKSLSHGILYKPENFDPKKKYPLIIHYYEIMSDKLFDFLTPEFIQGDINIPWLVSQGYLIFTPDIQYTVGKPGQSAYNSVVSAAKYLSRMSYIDAKKIGLQGHSFGGFQTNYLITHSNLFAAAVEGAGVVNSISRYGSINGASGASSNLMYETGQGRMGATLWERPDCYIENSPILKADKVTTPLLIMHNKNDMNVPWSQAVELFTALRRLRKKVWMLQYDDEGHTLYKDSNVAKDYTIRLTQFFDYYLKGLLPPQWMTNGIPAYKKGIEDGLELDLANPKL